MGDKRLEPFFIYKITEVAEGGTHDEKEDGCGEDDCNLDPFHAGDEGDGEEKDVSGKGDKDGDEEGILSIKRKALGIVPDGEEDDRDHQDGENPPEEFGD